MHLPLYYLPMQLASNKTPPPKSFYITIYIHSTTAYQQNFFPKTIKKRKVPNVIIESSSVEYFVVNALLVLALVKMLIYFSFRRCLIYV